MLKRIVAVESLRRRPRFSLEGRLAARTCALVRYAIERHRLQRTLQILSLIDDLTDCTIARLSVAGRTTICA